MRKTVKIYLGFLMAMIQTLTNKINKLFGFTNQEQISHNYDFSILVQLLSKLPEDVLIEILVRVPADVLVLLCPIWRNLISSPLFVDLHLKRAHSVHVVQSLYVDDGNKSKTQLSIVDCTKKKQCMDLVYDRVIEFLGGFDRTLWGSCGGLLAFNNPYNSKRRCISILNPITGENRDISTPTMNGYICGFFFNPFQARYKLLFVGWDESYVNFAYYTFDLSETLWTKLDLLNSRPGMGYPGVIVGDALHWIVNHSYACHCSKTLLVFKIETQELYALSHPPINSGGTIGCNFLTHDEYCMQLIAKDGQLCFCHIIAKENVVDLWILEDYDNWESWVKKFKVNLVSIHKKFPSNIWNIGDFVRGARIESPQNGSNEILVSSNFCRWKGLYGYHLETHRSRQLETTRSKRNMHQYIVLPYTKTMLSPMF